MFLYKHYLALAMALCVSVISIAQDIIIKQDKTEIQAKVSEITETTIKYKKWENVDGPLYNILKTDVFMILYSNGQREIIKQPETTPAQQVQQPNLSTYNNRQTTTPQSMANTKVDTTIDYKRLKVKYEPTRLDFGLQQPTCLGLSYEYRIVKNVFNIGFAGDYYFHKNSDVVSDNFTFLYGSLYAPMNRLLHHYDKQNKGIFIFAHAGYGVASVKTMDDYGKTSTMSTGGFAWRAGIDYYITKGFGVTLSSYEFKTAFAGIVFEW